MAAQSLTLYDLESTLACLVDTSEIIEESAEQARLAILDDIHQAHEAALKKRDNVIRLMRRLRLVVGTDEKKGLIDQEIDELRTFKQRLEAKQKRISAYLVGIIEQFGIQPKSAASKRLDGTVGVLRIQKNPDKADVSDEALVPSEYKTLTITVPATAWEAHIREHQRLAGVERPAILDQVRKTEVDVSRSRIKAAIESGAVVPGADIEIGKNRLVV